MVFSFFKNKSVKEQVSTKELGVMNQVDVCISNMTMYGETIYDELLRREDIQLNEYGCTSNCSLCARQLFVVVNEEVIKAKSEDQ